MVILPEIGRVCFRGLNNNYGIRLNEPRRRKGREGRTPPCPPPRGEEEDAVLPSCSSRLRGLIIPMQLGLV